MVFCSLPEFTKALTFEDEYPILVTTISYDPELIPLKAKLPSALVLVTREVPLRKTVAASTGSPVVLFTVPLILNKFWQNALSYGKINKQSVAIKLTIRMFFN